MRKPFKLRLNRRGFSFTFYGLRYNRRFSGTWQWQRARRDQNK